MTVPKYCPNCGNALEGTALILLVERWMEDALRETQGLAEEDLARTLGPIRSFRLRCEEELGQALVKMETDDGDGVYDVACGTCGWTGDILPDEETAAYRDMRLEDQS